MMKTTTTTTTGATPRPASSARAPVHATGDSRNRARTLARSNALLTARALLLVISGAIAIADGSRGIVVLIALVTHAATSLANARFDRREWAQALGIMGDMALLQWLTYTTGGIDGPAVPLMLLHMMVVALMGGQRVAIAVAGLYATLLVLVDRLVAAEILERTSSTFSTETRMILLIGAIGVMALTTTWFASVSERELRQRGARLQLLAESAMVDGLTGVPNRRAFDSSLSHELLQASRARSELALLLMDFDYFKLLNDRFGHLVGDDVLIEGADVLAAAVRPTDTFARYGGEEFAVVLPDTDAIEATAIAERLRTTVQQVTDPSGAPVTISIGVASIRPERGTDAEVLVREADRALYEAKAAGRDRVCAARPSSA